ncbi:MAG: outer membrane lipoprotein-sorting protein [Candidatus Latescibacteria bacterium]|nr:outer membrane lipoprotein-sorting protein [Candidatus Latescibacterota bacterium]
MRVVRVAAPAAGLALLLSGAAGTPAFPGDARAESGDMRSGLPDLPVPGGDARPIMERANLAYYYAGRDMRAKMTLELGAGQESKRRRVMTVLRLSEAPGGEQKYFLYFHHPGDVRRMSCMTWKHVAGADDRWMYVPLSGRVVRVRAAERSSFLGSEFVREEFSGRDVDAEEHRFVREEKLDGRGCYVVESLPKQSEEFARFISWIDRATALPLRQEFWNGRGERTRVFVAGRIEDIASRANPRRTYPTLMERTMTNASGRWTKVTLDSVLYDVGLRNEDFSERHLRTPISEWLP